MHDGDSSTSYSLDDFASHSENIESICKDIGSCKSLTSTDESYSLDDDFSSSSRKGKNISDGGDSVVPDSPKQCYQHDVPTCCDEFYDTVSASLLIASNQSPQHGKHVDQANFVECKQGHVRTNGDVARTDEDQQEQSPSLYQIESERIEIYGPTGIGVELTSDLDIVGTNVSEQSLVQQQIEIELDKDEYEYFGETEQRNLLQLAAQTKQQMPVAENEEHQCRSGEPNSNELKCDAQTQTQQKGPVREEKPHNSKAKKTASFVPRCAYAKTIAMKMYRGEIESKREKPVCRKTYSKRRLEELSKPFSRYKSSERENIAPSRTQRAKEKPLSCSTYDDGEDFLERQESRERQRQLKMLRRIEEESYNAKVDRKVCPNCGTIQSYDEMVEERAQCQNDGCKNGKHFYQPPARFVMKNFEQRMERSIQRRCLVLERIEGERRSSIVHTSQRRSRRQKALQEKVSKEGNDFNTRMTKDIEERKKKIQHLAEHQLQLSSKEYTFKPKLNVAEHLIRHRKGGWDSLSRPLRRYMQEYQPPEESRGEKKRRKWKKPLESPWESTRSNKKLNEEKMMKTFQRKFL